jgi:hypothetical protein
MARSFYAANSGPILKVCFYQCSRNIRKLNFHNRAPRSLAIIPPIESVKITRNKIFQLSDERIYGMDPGIPASFEFFIKQSLGMGCERDAL